jgi:hypothetical protein
MTGYPKGVEYHPVRHSHAVSKNNCFVYKVVLKRGNKKCLSECVQDKMMEVFLASMC